MHSQNRKRAVFVGLGAGLLLLLVYFVIMGLLSRSWEATISQFKSLWYWILALSLGFGIQIGIYTHLKKVIKNKSEIARSGTITATSTGTSTVSMVACCVHHVADALPIIGISGIAIFLSRYQIPIIISGLVFNIFGILYILKIIRKVNV